MRATVASASMLRPKADHEERHMLQHPAETLGRLLTAYNDHDAAGFAAQFAHDGVLRTVPTEAAERGRTQIEAWLQANVESFPDSRIERRAVHVCDAVIWVEWTVTGTHAAEFMGHPATHRGVELHGCSRFTFTPDGLIAEDALYFDPATTLRQLGLAHDAQRAT
jgi:steroid delta-isomerase-like uncharacterized protein